MGSLKEKKIKNKQKPKKPKSKKVKQGVSDKKIIGAAGIVGTTALVAYLTKKNIDLRKTLDGLKNELEHYKAQDGKLSFSLFGKQKPTEQALARQIRDLDKEIVNKNQAIASLEKGKETCDKAYIEILKNLDECNKGYRELLETLKQRNKDYEELVSKRKGDDGDVKFKFLRTEEFPKIPGWNKEKPKSRMSV